MKICSTCKTPKPFALFSNLKASKDGKYSICKPCHKIAQDRRTPKQRRKELLLYKYKMTEKDFQNMLIFQDNKCKICMREKKLVVDHCHDTNTVRGLLCTSCNTTLGRLFDSPHMAMRCANYILLGGKIE